TKKYTSLDKLADDATEYVTRDFYSKYHQYFSEFGNKFSNFFVSTKKLEKSLVDDERFSNVEHKIEKLLDMKNPKLSKTSKTLIELSMELKTMDKAFISASIQSK